MKLIVEEDGNSIGFEVFTMMTKSVSFWVVILRSLDRRDISEEHVASIFRDKMEEKQEA